MNNNYTVDATVESDRKSLRWRKDRMMLQLMREASKAYDMIWGVDFEQRAGDIENDYMPYEGTSVLCFRNLKKYLSRFKHVSIMDVGCGKGKMLSFFAYVGCNRVVGLEHSQELINIAHMNLNRLEQMGYLNKRNIHIVQADASVFKNYTGYNVFYLYNPFVGNTMERFLDNLIQNVCDYWRPIKLIYNNPICEDILVRKGFILEEELYYRIKVYSFSV